MIDQEQITAGSKLLLQNDMRVLQGYRIANTEREHVARLLGYMAPGEATKWLDIGCGFGEPARLMKEMRPDLDFWMVNNNSFQLSQAWDQTNTYCCDMHELPFMDGEFDGAMFLYSLMQADDWKKALSEASRVVKRGGRLFVFDHLRTGGNNDLSQKHLCSRFSSYMEWLSLMRETDWCMDEIALPDGSDSIFRALLGNGLYEQIFRDLLPAVWWATRT